MGRNNKIKLENRFALLIAHLLKWQFQFNIPSEWDGKSWRNTIIEQRFQINRNLRKNLSLTAYLSQALQEAYPDAVYLAAKETELPKEIFPQQCPYTCEQLLDDEFYPTGKSA